jgi:periplasmic protein TonB
MSLEATRVPENGFGSLQSCLVEGDPQSEKRARRIKQRAVAISIALQTLALTALILFPLLSKGERISLQNFTPIPPYAPIGDHHRSVPSDPGRHAPAPCRICPPRNIPPTIMEHLPNTSTPPDDSIGEIIPGALNREGIIGSTNLSSEHPVPPPAEAHETPVLVRRSELQQMAQLITRIEPRYPAIAIQIHHEGRVELHALISPEGTIESLEVLSGDPLFIQSALAAVHQWRYRPTILNGRPIEVDTHITVIYTLSH